MAFICLLGKGDGPLQGCHLTRHLCKIQAATLLPTPHDSLTQDSRTCHHVQAHPETEFMAVQREVMSHQECAAVIPWRSQKQTGTW